MEKEVEVKIKLEDYVSKEIPTYAHEGDACVDLKCMAIDTDMHENIIILHTGVHVELPEGYVMLIIPRSSNCKTPLYMPNSIGVIDSGYRGEILVKYRSTDRIMFVLPYPKIKFTEVEQLSESNRGNGGFGSTGR